MNKELKIPKNTVIHCPTKELANKVLVILDKLGHTWSGGKSLLKKNYYRDYGSSICYNPSYLDENWVCCADFEYYKDRNYKIIEATEFINLHMTPKEILLNKIKECKIKYPLEYNVVIAESKSKNKYICIDDMVMLNVNMNGFMKITDYNENLEIKTGQSNWDIECIYTVNASYPKSDFKDVVWTKPEIKEVTLKEIAEKFGVSVDSIRIKD